MRRLIINADDFGMTAGVNRAVTEAHAAGVVTSATMMANETATADAIGRASQSPRLSVGCHVVLVDGRPLSLPNRVPSLIGFHNGDGPHFRPGIAGLAMAALSTKVSEPEVHAEASTQIETLKKQGVNLSHIDCHMHSHILPVILRGVLQAARDHGIVAVRNPFEPAWSVSATRKGTSLRSWTRSLQVSILRALEQQFRSTVKEDGVKTPDGTIGIAVTGLLDRDLLVRLVSAMPDGTWELVTHPGYNDDDLTNATTDLKRSRAVELEVLTSPETLDLLRKRGIRLISYRDL
jgi:hopanoid biosynthesis associated protein HpnK